MWCQSLRAKKQKQEDDKMRKVFYSITKRSKKENDKFTGVGFIKQSDLLIACLGKKGTAYIKNFEDCLKYCFPIMNKTNEFKGEYSEWITCDVPTTDERERNPEVKNYETIEIQLNYTIWYKIIED